MTAQAQVSPERMQQLRQRAIAARAQEEVDRPQVIADYKAMLKDWERIVASHSHAIDEYIAAHGPMSRAEVLDRALSKLLSEV